MMMKLNDNYNLSLLIDRGFFSYKVYMHLYEKVAINGDPTNDWRVFRRVRSITP
jgi:hypothetical protein